MKPFKGTLSKKSAAALWIGGACLAVALLTMMQFATLRKNYRYRSYQSADLLLHDVEQVIAYNQEDRRHLEHFLKETYRDKARTAAQMIGQRGIERDLNALQELATLLGVDEIHLFDESGRIFSGTMPGYYGYCFDSGLQMREFRPMLEDKSLTMSQNVMPNTSEGKLCMYSICWNEAGTYMVQVGADGNRFPKIMRSSELEAIIARLPGNQEAAVLVTEANSDVVEASTLKACVGKTMEELGLEGEQLCPHSEESHFRAHLLGNEVLCAQREYGDQRILVAQDQGPAHRAGSAHWHRTFSAQAPERQGKSR